MDIRFNGKRTVTSYEQIANLSNVEIIVETKKDYISFITEFISHCMVKRLDSKNNCNVSAWIREYGTEKAMDEGYDRMFNRLKIGDHVYFSKDGYSLYQGFGYPSSSREFVIYKSNPYTVDLV